MNKPLIIFLITLTSISFISALGVNIPIPVSISSNSTGGNGSSYNATYAIWAYNQSQGVILNEILNPLADKTFSMNTHSLSFSFTNPSNQPTYDGAFEIEGIGAFSGDLLHVHQHIGNPGASHLVHIESDDPDVIGVNITTTGSGMYINGNLVDKWLYNMSDGTGGTNYWQTNGTAVYNSTVVQVGIGTATPTAELHINGGDYSFASGGDLRIGSSTNALKFGVATGGAGSGNTFITTDASGSQGYIGIGTRGSTSQLFLNYNGNVGIGTVSPSGLLSIGQVSDGNNSKYIYIGGINTGQSDAIFMTKNGDVGRNWITWNQGASGLADWRIGMTQNTLSGYALSIYNANGSVSNATNPGLEVLRFSGYNQAGNMILPNGRFGINTTSPTQMLDVRGVANFSGTIYINNATDVSTLGALGANYWRTNGTSLYNNTAAKFGFGTATPTYKLDLVGVGTDAAGTTAIMSATTYSSGGAAADRAILLFRRANGNEASPTLVSNGDQIGSFQANAYNGGFFGAGAGIIFTIDGAYTSGQRAPMAITFQTAIANGAGVVDRMKISANGTVGIGTTAPRALLHINGTGALLNVSNETSSYFFVSQTGGGIVGINTPAPSATLDVHANDSSALGNLLQLSDKTGNPKLIVLNNGNTNISLNLTVNGTIRQYGCPSNFTRYGLGCIQLTEEGYHNFTYATDTCYNKYNGRLPRLRELQIGVRNLTLNNESIDEWVDDPIPSYAVVFIPSCGVAALSAGTQGQQYLGVDCSGATNYSYRCFVPFGGGK